MRKKGPSCAPQVLFSFLSSRCASFSGFRGLIRLVIALAFHYLWTNKMKNSAFESDNKGCRRLGNHFARFAGPFQRFLVSLQRLSPRIFQSDGGAWCRRSSWGRWRAFIYCEKRSQVYLICSGESCGKERRNQERGMPRRDCACVSGCADCRFEFSGRT